MDIDNATFNRAVRIYIGYGITSFPDQDQARLIAKFGPELGTLLYAKINTLLDELDHIKPDTDTLILSSKRAAAELKQNHPELDPNTIDALEWIYSWGYK
ncbi:MAG TPA: hypothetical protein VFB72_20770 [Verrucomicrobiae bacterium]|nr:hypothetical protein [Verrucomicrobiae bacterium]